MGGESGKRSASRRHSWRAMSRRRQRAPRSQPPDGAKADGRGSGIGSKCRRSRRSQRGYCRLGTNSTSRSRNAATSSAVSHRNSTSSRRSPRDSRCQSARWMRTPARSSFVRTPCGIQLRSSSSPDVIRNLYTRDVPTSEATFPSHGLCVFVNQRTAAGLAELGIGITNHRQPQHPGQRRPVPLRRKTSVLANPADYLDGNHDDR